MNTFGYVGGEPNLQIDIKGLANSNAIAALNPILQNTNVLKCFTPVGDPWPHWFVCAGSPRNCFGFYPNETNATSPWNQALENFNNAVAGRPGEVKGDIKDKGFCSPVRILNSCNKQEFEACVDKSVRNSYMQPRGEPWNLLPNGANVCYGWREDKINTCVKNICQK